MPRKIPFKSDSESDSVSQPPAPADPVASSTRREAMGAGGLALAALFGWDLASLFGGSVEPNQLTDNGEAVIDLDDITGVNLRNGLDVDKDAGVITIDSQAVEEALISALDGGTEVASAVDGFDFGTDLDVTDNEDGTVTIDYAGSGDGGGGGGGLTEVESGETTLEANDTEFLQLPSLDRDGFYIARAYPDENYSGLEFAKREGTANTGYAFYYDGADGAYNLDLSNGESEPLTVTWKVFEV